VRVGTILETYLDELQANGRYSFTTEEAQKTLGTSIAATQAVLRRLKTKKRIASPYRGFYIVIPPEYRKLECLPPEEFIPDLMFHLGEPYYVALLSSASLFGAAHQRPQVFQVMVHKARRKIVCGGVVIQFVARHNMQNTPVSEQNTSRGILRFSTAEATALELVGYMNHCGGINTIVTVLIELCESINSEQLRQVATLSPVAWVQRLGYLLSFIGENDQAKILENVLSGKKLFPVSLVPDSKAEESIHDRKWNILVNSQVDSDI